MDGTCSLERLLSAISQPKRGMQRIRLRTRKSTCHVRTQRTLRCPPHFCTFRHGTWHTHLQRHLCSCCWESAPHCTSIDLMQQATAHWPGTACKAMICSTPPPTPLVPPCPLPQTLQTLQTGPLAETSLLASHRSGSQTLERREAATYGCLGISLVSRGLGEICCCSLFHGLQQRHILKSQHIVTFYSKCTRALRTLTF